MNEALRTAPPTAGAGTSAAALRDLAAEDRAVVEKVVAAVGGEPDKVIPLLQAVQDHYRYLPPQVLEALPALTGIGAATITAISTFYHQFRHKPMGQHHVRVCIGTACHVANASALTERFQEELGLEEGQDTDGDGEFTVEEVACLGCCSLAPVVQIHDEMHGPLDPDDVPDLIDDTRKGGDAKAGRDRYSEEGLADRVPEVRIALDSCCLAVGSDKVYAALRREVGRLGTEVRVKSVGCWGMASRSPVVEVAVPGEDPVVYTQVAADDAAGIVQRHFRSPRLGTRIATVASRAVDRLLTDATWAGVERSEMTAESPEATDFLGPQVRIATEHYGVLDPTSLADYRERDGFAAMERAYRSLSVEEIIGIVEASGLRGRGGGGFPTGRKWRLVHNQPAGVKYVICNGDEGDPGAFMDRQILENFPFRVIEGMAIAARAIGAEEGVFYVRDEYPLAIRRLQNALELCAEAGVLGDDVLGTGRRLHLRIFHGAGAFVCGEETALIHSIEGRPGFPRPRPPFPSESGLYGRPTLTNNVETYANVPWIVRHGPEAFAAYGTEHSKGTKVFALAGKVNRGGLIEVPMGISIRRIVEEVGGGIPNGRAFKAVQIGGPSGGCIPASLADTPIDYQELGKLGAIMGSGGLVVLDDTDCMVDIARYFMSFTQAEACGQCSAGRIGTRRLLDILERLCGGTGTAEDVGKLGELSELVTHTALCGLCKTAPNPVLTTLRYFPEEYQAHVDGHCPAGVCTDLIRYEITDDCNGCTLCAQVCRADAIEMRPYRRHEIDPDKCVRCDACRKICPLDAVVIR